MTEPTSLSETRRYLLVVRGCAGLSMREIAAEFGVREDEAQAVWEHYAGTVDRHRRKRAMALFDTTPASIALKGRVAAPASSVLKGGVAGAERDQLIELGRSGLDFAEIGRRFSISSNSAKARWRKYADDADKSARQIAKAAKASAAMAAAMETDAKQKLIELGRSGISFAEIGRLIDLTGDAAHGRWGKYAQDEDRAARAAAVKLLASGRSKAKRKRRQYDKSDDGAIRHEPPVGRILREFPACSFPDDPRAERNLGSARGAMPPRPVWRLGNDALA